ncbi:MAG: hypothetical protein ABH811_00345 [archaeon]
MKKWNKKGGDKVMTLYWFAILFLVAGAIVYMTALYYGKPYDIREIEANFLTNKVADCLSEGGRLVDNWRDIKTENFLQKCGLTFNVEDTEGWKAQEQYYVEVNFRKFDGSSVEKESIIIGNKNLKDFCDKEGVNLPVCSEREFYVLGPRNIGGEDKLKLDTDANTQYIIKIKSIVRKTEKNVQ